LLCETLTAPTVLNVCLVASRLLNKGGFLYEQESTHSGRSLGMQEAQTKRGQHVKNKPWMSAKGREGQRAWEDNLARVRQEWLKSGIPAHPDLHLREMLLEQIEWCKQRKMKKQKETLLLVLQMCAHRRVIRALPFVHPSTQVYSTCAPVSFLGWTGFQVIPHNAEAFADELMKLFPNMAAGGTRKDLFSSRSAMVEAFRRAGLLPEIPGRWEEAFRGQGRFTFTPSTPKHPPTPAQALKDDETNLGLSARRRHAWPALPGMQCVMHFEKVEQQHVLQQRRLLFDKETELQRLLVVLCARQEAWALFPRRLPSPATPPSQQAWSQRHRVQVLCATPILVCSLRGGA
jgi:hypothetical protein